MLSRRSTVSCFLLVSLLSGCDGPFLLLPGGALEGPIAEAPADWVFSDEVSTVQVETHPEDPYSINIWAVGVGDQLYLHAGGNRTAWIENIEANSHVRVAIDGTLYELAASRVEDVEEFARFADAYEVKYGLRPRNEKISEIYVYRMGKR
ncbi:MAG: DUF2255 family protein [bacterium]|nr:hypothetical protein [Deltaproteobacteria bacterium]MCP4904345.1 DUF2255 family protein [bacterium]